MSVVEIIAAILMGGGVLLGLVAAIGVNRFEGVLMRIHAASKPQMLGLILVLSGASLAAESWSLAAFLLVVLLAQALAVPVASVMVGRAAFRRGFVRGGDYAIDELSPRLADADDEDDDEDGFIDETDELQGMSEGGEDRFPENVVTSGVDPLVEENWEEPEAGAEVGDEEVVDADIDIDLEDETEREAEEVAERDVRR
ncbi:monovalent cation/H(+) antiporter subunit G [Brachybacterium sp. UMB0905]|uniref:cation:proton antiporter n=1 Tax=Brachybacterium sp. UMB0905 TaxID=2069310 RepID=UPI000C7FCBA0|nr:monovalent cation/H(+) antiporter subunit G [Brachybacterium sp. UMB0905]PMC76785.1 sodium:proton antiporter [Brachybacterium sp. UMB0905]